MDRSSIEKMASENSSPTTTIFLHIPKTAGSTLHAILKQQYRPETLVHLRGKPHIQSAIAEFEKMGALQKAQISLLTGHFEYGIHHYLSQPAIYFTLLRNPVERVISYYYFIFRTPAHPRYEEMTQNNTTIETFVTDILTDNNQTRMIAGAWMDNDAPCTEATLTLAKQHINNHFTVVGLTEQFDTTLLLLKHALGWQRLSVYGNRNVSQNRPTRKGLTAVSLSAIQKTQSFDIRLYAHTEALFHKKVRQMGPIFALQLLTHRLRQQASPRYHALRRHSIREFIRQRIQSS
jgi:hypothetical protein